MSLFSDDDLLYLETKSGFRQQLFVMYHGTSVENAHSIIASKFDITTGSSMLGNGVYVSKDVEKAQNYGEVVFRLLVYPGWVCKVDRQGHPLQKTWQKEGYGSAWVPPECGMVNSGLEENCVRSPSQVKILGVVRGWDLLNNNTIRDCEFQENLHELADEDEEDAMEDLMLDLGLGFRTLKVRGLGYLVDDGGADGEVRFAQQIPAANADSDWDNYRWTTTWDGCLENQQTGRVVAAHFKTGGVFTMTVVDRTGGPLLVRPTLTPSPSGMAAGQVCQLKLLKDSTMMVVGTRKWNAGVTVLSATGGGAAGTRPLMALMRRRDEGLLRTKLHRFLWGEDWFDDGDDDEYEEDEVEDDVDQPPVLLRYSMGNYVISVLRGATVDLAASFCSSTAAG